MNRGECKDMRFKVKLSGRYFVIAVIPLILIICACASFEAAEISDDDYVPGEVLAFAVSMEHALEIAAEYELELLSYAHGIAVFSARNPQALVAQSDERRVAGVPGTDFSLNWVYRTPGEDI